ncbi:MAG: hypothetical protein ACRD4S_02250 [Candidatus Acidiferrales bacterium]
MRFLGVGFLFAALVVGITFGQRQIPPGVRQADKAVEQGSANVESPIGPVRRTIDPAEVKAEAAQLQSLAAEIPAQVDQATKGIFQKDLSANLKKIEKLAKHLRSEVNP